MLYASSKDALRKSLVGISSEIQGTDMSEVAHETGAFSISLSHKAFFPKLICRLQQFSRRSHARPSKRFWSRKTKKHGRQQALGPPTRGADAALCYRVREGDLFFPLCQTTAANLPLLSLPPSHSSFCLLSSLPYISSLSWRCRQSIPQRVGENHVDCPLGGGNLNVRI